ncbi:hypothetical protein MNBD_GAMMA09-569 [hydrothermal vent metagenome]|uniref:NADP-dependent oxidoreductase domain-containing protein n=1 Tax=hydrothermal vent metagenome TaxID=652676 RepID=A0A3B0Y3K8_9ZZZZ
MSSIIVLQARTSSTRMPAKVLLPICKIPLVVLAAMRASNKGMRVVVVTSVDSSDDALAETLKDYGVSCFRGSLDNTLKRFVDALNDYNDDEIVVRLTGDNVFPDGDLIAEVEKNFKERKLDYLCCNGEQSGLPYGVSVEVTYLRHLRDAYRSTDSDFDKEHVTPYIIRQFGLQYFKKYKQLGKGLYRSTVDSLDDYLQIKQVFSDVENPVSISLFELLDRLSVLKNIPIVKRSVSQLVVGGAQFGMEYGITNISGRSSSIETEKLIKTAINNGVSYLDTAHAYGDSESVIGRILTQGWNSRVNIITKLSPLADCPENAEKEIIDAFVEASVFKSCMHLNCQKLDVLMLHRAQHINEWQGYVWDKLIAFKKSGTVGKLGASVQTPDELEYVLEEPFIEFVQMPFNIIDGRWDTIINKLRNIKSSRKVTIHVRSSLLQGLLLSDDPKLWGKANSTHYSTIVNWLNELVVKYKRKDVLDLCLAFVRSQDWVDGIVVGMETNAQLVENIKYFDTDLLIRPEIEQIESQRPAVSEMVLNPANWREG